MSCFYTKYDLYVRVDEIRNELKVQNKLPISNIRQLLSQIETLKIKSLPFKTKSLHGICSFGKTGQIDVILLNSNRSEEEQNFDCAHEYMHIHEHRYEQKDYFRCYESVINKQNQFLEWQANEGAAELVVPYRDFIPSFVQLFDSQGEYGYADLYIHSLLADKYHVSYNIIYNRIENLRYEIDQYRQGIGIDQILLLSKRKQMEFGIVTTDYNAMCDFSVRFA